MTWLDGIGSSLRVVSRAGLVLAVLAVAGCGPKADEGGDGGDGSGDDGGDGGDGGGDDGSDDGGGSGSGGGDDDGGDGSDGGDDGSGTGGGDAGWAACEVTSDCVLAANSCCGPCGAPGLGDVDGVNKDRLDQHDEEVCPVPEPCPGCPGMPNPFLVVTCADATCTPVDLKMEDVTECSSDDECVLRTADCCPCGGNVDPWAVIAIRADAEGAYSMLVCDPDIGCPECEPVYPEEARAFCNEDGRCDVEISP